MPCSSATVQNVPSLTPDQEIGAAMKLFKKHQRESFPVVDDDGVLLGFLSQHIVLKNLIPVSFNIPGAGQGSVTIGAAPGIAKRLKKIKPLKVEDLMERKFHSIHPETPIWEGIHMLVEHGSPLMVVEEKTGKFIGLIDRFSAIEELERLQKQDKGE
ncbi:MAG: CBS domain-containing protein [Alphaproteobacteria bacterium]|nr:CBS domain-containing protein [Alphaproteobacteria bacterium]